MLLASADGAELYEFDAAGRHRQTLSTTTRDTIYAFAYDSAGRLSRVVDWNSDTTRIERDGTGVPSAIVAPYGQRTILSVDAAGYLDSIANPAGEVVRPVTAANGLLSSLVGPRGHTSFFGYDSLGRLITVNSPKGGTERLTTVRSDSVGEVTYQTALGRMTSYRIEGIPSDGERRITTDPAGLVTTKVTDLAGRTTTALPTGDSVGGERPDPAGDGVADSHSLTIRTPSGLRATLKGRRRVTFQPERSVQPHESDRLTGSQRRVDGEHLHCGYAAASPDEPEGRQLSRP
jgi:YD repeat-containing protein